MEKSAWGGKIIRPKQEQGHAQVTGAGGKCQEDEANAER